MTSNASTAEVEFWRRTLFIITVFLILVVAAGIGLVVFSGLFGG